MTSLDLYLWTVRNLGVPKKTNLQADGSLEMEGPYTKLSPAEVAGLEQRAEELCHP